MGNTPDVMEGYNRFLGTPKDVGILLILSGVLILVASLAVGLHGNYGYAVFLAMIGLGVTLLGIRTRKSRTLERPSQPAPQLPQKDVPSKDKSIKEAFMFAVFAPANDSIAPPINRFLERYEHRIAGPIDITPVSRNETLIGLIFKSNYPGEALQIMGEFKAMFSRYGISVDRK